MHQSETVSSHSPQSTRSEQGSRLMTRQIPPNWAAVKLAFTVSGNDFIKVAATGSNPNVGTNYQQDTEYWYDKSTTVVGIQQLSMTLTTSNYTEQELSAFFSGMSQAFTEPETVSKTSWIQGQYTPPAGTTARLFRAVDPDNPAKYIGMVVVQNGNKKLVATAWYKTSQPAGGWVWASANTPSSLTWTLVTDGSGNPTLNPSYIQSGQTWYHVAQS